MIRRWPPTVGMQPIPIYGGYLAVCRSRSLYSRCATELGDTRAQIKYDIDGVGCAKDFPRQDKAPIYLIGLFDQEIGTIAHEAGHIVFKVLRRAGIPITQHNDEVFCHLLDEILTMSVKPK